MNSTLRSTKHVVASESAEPELRVVVFGKTGVGKSSLANTLLDTDECETGAGADSITKTSQRVSRTRDTGVGRMKLSIVDTPWLFDTRYSNAKTTEEIGCCVELSLPGPHVFILVTSVTQRFTEEDMNTIETLHNQFGERMIEYMMVVFTSKDRLGKMSPSEYIKHATDPLKKILHGCCNRYAFIDTEDQTPQKQDDVDDIMKIVGNIIKKNNEKHYSNRMYAEAVKRQKEEEEKRRKEKERQERSTKHVKASESDETELRMVMFGKTGVGKSSLANTLLDTDEFETGVGAGSITKSCQRVSKTRDKTIGRKTLSIVDTPGLYDTRCTNAITTLAIGRCVELSLPGPHVFILVISLAQRFTEEDMNTIETLQNQFGERMIEYMMVVFTSKDRLGNISPSEYIKHATDPLKKILHGCCNRFAFIDTEDQTPQKQDDVDDIMKIVGNIIKKNNEAHYSNRMYAEAVKRKKEEEEKRRKEKARQKRKLWLQVGFKVVATGVSYWYGGVAPVAGVIACSNIDNILSTI